mmetsp:Transcript_12632/g.36261  ORF Transcript_12632/g.36261 Transcript_12632/m.36261 type:complete len:260 (+) Transcript_12632:691-1470(+)
MAAGMMAGTCSPGIVPAGSPPERLPGKPAIMAIGMQAPGGHMNICGAPGQPPKQALKAAWFAMLFAATAGWVALAAAPRHAPGAEFTPECCEEGDEAGAGEWACAGGEDAAMPAAAPASGKAAGAGTELGAEAEAHSEACGAGAPKLGHVSCAPPWKKPGACGPSKKRSIGDWQHKGSKKPSMGDWQPRMPFIGEVISPWGCRSFGDRPPAPAPRPLEAPAQGSAAANVPLGRASRLVAMVLPEVFAAADRSGVRSHAA